MDKRTQYLNNLPKVDENSEIQENSLNALNTFLLTNQFCLRDERIRDYGVDASLEILENGSATNFRTQIQLKGTRSLKPIKDGSYSLQVETKNLQYLLNAPLSMYILYIEPIKEFRFVWASTEFQRLSEENPKWIEQDDITLKFIEVLDLTKLDEIKGIIISKGVFARNLNETLLLSKSPNVVLEINSETFEITDKNEILSLITHSGINLINEGYHIQVLENINLLDLKDRENTAVVTVKAYAEYICGHYNSARETVALLKISERELSNEDKQIISFIEFSCDYRLGKINFEDRAEKIKELAEKDAVEKFSSYRFDYIYCLLCDEKKSVRRNDLVAKLRSEIEKLPTEELLGENILVFKYRILEAELGTLIKDFSENLFNISIRKNLNIYKGIYDLAEDVRNLFINHRERKDNWINDYKEIFRKTKNNLLKADLNVEYVLLFIGEYIRIKFHSMANSLPFEFMDDDLFEFLKNSLEEAISVYSELNFYERKLRAESRLAELIHLKGNNEEANTKFREVSDKSSVLGYEQVKANSDNPLSLAFERIIDEAQNADFDEKQANMSDDEINDFAQCMLENLGIPQSRFSNVKKDVTANRELLQEKFTWCEYIELHQDLLHTQSKATYYAKDPERFGFCSKHNYNSIFGSSDYNSVILAFKKAYCEKCLDRKPKAGTET